MKTIFRFKKWNYIGKNQPYHFPLNKSELFQCKNAVISYENDTFNNTLHYIVCQRYHHVVQSVYNCVSPDFVPQQYCVVFGISMSASGLWCNWMGPTALARGRKYSLMLHFAMRKSYFITMTPSVYYDSIAHDPHENYKCVNEFACIDSFDYMSISQFSVTLFLWCAPFSVSVKSWIKNKTSEIAL